MTVRLVGAGLGRTGTTSLREALSRLLGEPCYHMMEVLQNPAHADVWRAAYEGDPPDWQAFLAGYGAIVDWPGAAFWEPLAEAFPDAPILLSTRDADDWWRSASDTIFRALEPAFATDAPSDPWSRMARVLIEEFTPDWRDEVAAKAAYEAHNEHVRAAAPADRLIEWHPRDGWGPICTALGLPEPAEPFPHVNTTAEFQAMLAERG